MPPGRFLLPQMLAGSSNAENIIMTKQVIFKKKRKVCTLITMFASVWTTSSAEVMTAAVLEAK